MTASKLVQRIRATPAGAKLACIVLLTFVAYLPAMIQGGYIWDDDSYVTQNELLTASDGLQRIWFRPTDSPQYYPMVFTTFRLEHAIWGLNPTGYHVVNVFLHIANALLLWVILLRLDVPCAWFAALVFAVHPLHVESVAWITERKNILSGTFYLLAFLCYWRSVGQRHIVHGWSWRWYAASAALFCCALLSKTVTFTLPVVLLIMLWWRRRGAFARHVPALAPYLLVGIAMGMVTAVLDLEHVGAVGREWNLSLMQRFLVAGRACWFYVGKLLWPINLSFVYPRWSVDIAVPSQWLWPATAGAVVAICALLMRRIGPGPLVAVGCYVLTLGPALGFVNFYPMRYSFVADHFAYLASVPIIAFVVAAAFHLVRHPSILRNVAAAVVVLALGTRTFVQTRCYKNEETLWRTTLRENPEAWIAHVNLGNLLKTQEKFDDAITHYRRALELFPEDPVANYDLGLVLALLGRFDEARPHLERALSPWKGLTDAHGTLGNVLLATRRTDKAIRHFRIALKMDPNVPDIHFNLGLALEVKGELRRALGAFRQAAQLDPELRGVKAKIQQVLERLGNSATDADQ